MTKPASPTPIDSYIEQLAKLPFWLPDTPPRDPPRPATRAKRGVSPGVIRFPTPDKQEHALDIVLQRTNLDPVAAERLATEQTAHRAARIVMAPYIGEGPGEILERAKVNFVDLLGNCSLRLGDRYVARIQRHRPPPRETQAKGTRAAGYQVIMALLIDPTLLTAPLEAIAKAAGTSRQAPFAMLRRLHLEGFIVKAKRRTLWVPEQRAALIDRFFIGYRDVLRPKLMQSTWRTKTQDPFQLEAQLRDVLGPVEAWRYGGAAGGYRLDPYYRSPNTVVHLTALPPDFARRIFAATSRDGNLRVLGVPGPIAWTGPHPESVHPLLVCAELLALPDDRGHETAHLLRERFLL
jgi:hypothetical protein